MSFAWADYHRTKLNISLSEYYCMPLGEFNDLVACYLIEHGAKPARKQNWDDLFPDI